MNVTYQLGLLHIVYSLINADGRIDDREMDALQIIQREENIPDQLFRDFARSLVSAKPNEVYTRGVNMLNACTEEEKLCAFVHLFKLAEADTSINMNEVRLLMKAVQLTKVDFDDVAVITKMSGSSKQNAA
jgi:uncharacterized tellurite resistance protein B-like protein